MNKEINSNGFGYVNLDLPSGTLWATCNVGASKPSDFGLYFQWGDVKGCTKGQVGTDKGQKEFSFNWDDYKFSIDGNDSNFSKYKTTGATLDLEDDATHVHMGGSWHMPTPQQIQELLDNTISKWTKQGGVNGRLFISKKEPSKSIFIPAAGSAWDGSLYDSGGYGYVWSSMLSAGYVNRGQRLYFISGGAHLSSSLRGYGFSVRGVIG